MAPIRALIIDDESLARERIRSLLAAHDDIQVAGEARDGREAVLAIRQHAPDLVFLDIEMPHLDAFGVIAEVGVENMPAVVFATAYDEFAVRAFDANAVDYLLKPVAAERLAGTLRRVRQRIGERSGHGLRSEFMEWLANREAPGQAYRERFAVRTRSGFQVVITRDIVWIEAADNYVRIHASAGDYLLRESIAEIQAALDPARFIRVHRSSIIAIDAVRTIEPWGAGEFVFVLASGDKVSSSRRYRDDIRRVFGC